MTHLAAAIPMSTGPSSDRAPGDAPEGRGGEARPLLFCPFCRECFEGEAQCPEHELALVRFEDLPREEDPDALVSTTAELHAVL